MPTNYMTHNLNVFASHNTFYENIKYISKNNMYK